MAPGPNMHEEDTDLGPHLIQVDIVPVSTTTPTATPSIVPTSLPTNAVPTLSPTNLPTKVPTNLPSEVPAAAPSATSTSCRGRGPRSTGAAPPSRGSEDRLPGQRHSSEDATHFGLSTRARSQGE
jgi:hypothetical protein